MDTGVPKRTVSRSLIASWMSSSPSVAAGSMVLSVVGTCPPHDGVRGGGHFGAVTTYSRDAQDQLIRITFPGLSYPLLRRAKGAR